MGAVPCLPVTGRRAWRSALRQALLPGYEPVPVYVAGGLGELAHGPSWAAEPNCGRGDVNGKRR